MYEIGPVTLEVTDYLTQLAIWKMIFIYSDSSDRVGKKFKCKGIGKSASEINMEVFVPRKKMYKEKKSKLLGFMVNSSLS